MVIIKSNIFHHRYFCTIRFRFTVPLIIAAFWLCSDSIYHHVDDRGHNLEWMNEWINGFLFLKPERWTGHNLGQNCYHKNHQNGKSVTEDLSKMVKVPFNWCAIKHKLQKSYNKLICFFFHRNTKKIVKKCKQLLKTDVTCLLRTVPH